MFKTSLLLLMLSAPAWAAWTNRISNTNASCTSGTSCTVTVTTTSGWLVVVVAQNQNTAITSCCGGTGCTWTQDISGTSSGNIYIYHSTNCGVTSTAIGPTYGSACTAGPNCFTDLVAWSSSTGSIAVDGTAVHCTTFTWCSPTGLSSKNDVFVAGIDTSGDATGCSGGSSPTCAVNSNGNGAGYESNVTGTSYSAPSWTGTSGTNNVVTAAYSEAAASGGCTTAFVAAAGGGCH